MGADDAALRSQACRFSGSLRTCPSARLTHPGPFSPMRFSRPITRSWRVRRVTVTVPVVFGCPVQTAWKAASLF